MSSSWSASQRYELAPAPGGLGLVQDFLNTTGIEGYGPDLLADPALARDWAAGAVRTWTFTPARLNGQAVEAHVGIVFQFPQSFLPHSVSKERKHEEVSAESDDRAGRATRRPA